MVRRAALVAACLLLLSACGGAECPAEGLPSGISLHVDAALARAAVAEVTVCEGGSCQSRRVPLHPATAPAATTCAGDDCGAALQPTGGQSGFAGFTVPATTVRVTVALFDAADQLVIRGTVEASAPAPTTADCSPGGRRISVAVTDSGVTTV